MRELIRDLLYGLVLWFDTTFPKPARDLDEHEDVNNTGLVQFDNEQSEKVRRFFDGVDGHTPRGIYTYRK